MHFKLRNQHTKIKLTLSVPNDLYMPFSEKPFSPVLRNSILHIRGHVFTAPRTGNRYLQYIQKEISAEFKNKSVNPKSLIQKESTTQKETSKPKRDL